MNALWLDFLSNVERHVFDAQTIMVHYQESKKRLDKATTAMRTKLEQTENDTQKLHDDKVKFAQELHQKEDALRAAREETDAVLKRNEFWVDQLAQLRTKHEALKFKLRNIGERKHDAVSA
jgi:chromosome segregation ATPase